MAGNKRPNWVTESSVFVLTHLLTQRRLESYLPVCQVTAKKEKSRDVGSAILLLNDSWNKIFFRRQGKALKILVSLVVGHRDVASKEEK